jgi:DNA-binding NarL/FixJ family response regulator
MAAYQDSVLKAATADEQPEEQECIRVLVVDDSENALRAICALIELEPMVEIVGRACNGVEAIGAVASLKPDLVVMDVNMPYLDGLKTSGILSTHFPDLKILLMSADDDPELRIKSRAHGADAFIPKQELLYGLSHSIRELYPERMN